MEIGVFEIAIGFIVLLGAYHWGRMSMLGDIVRELKAKGVLPEDLKADKDRKFEDDSNDEVIKVERHQGMVYAFGANDRFLGQGASYDDLFTAIKHRFPGQTFRVQKDGVEDSEFEKMVTSIFKIFGDRNDKSN